MLSLFNVLRFPLVVLPKALRCVSEALNACVNLEKFLTAPAAPKQDTEGAPGAKLSKVRAGWAVLQCLQSLRCFHWCAWLHVAGLQLAAEYHPLPLPPLPCCLTPAPLCPAPCPPIRPEGCAEACHGYLWL